MFSHPSIIGPRYSLINQVCVVFDNN